MNINFKGGYLNFIYFNQSRLDFVQWFHGQCPVNPWTQWTLSMDVVQSAWTPWTLSRVSMDNVQTVHWVNGQCPLNPWTLSTGWSGLCPEYPWTLSRLSTESMVNVHWVHGQCPGSPLSPWTFYRWVGSLGWDPGDGILPFSFWCLFIPSWKACN